MIPMVAVEFDTVERKFNRIIEFDMDGGKNFCYRGRTSYEAFATPYKKRNYNEEAKLKYQCKRLQEFKWDLRSWQRMMIRDPSIEDIYDLPRIKVKSLWDFYKEIGYDYKKKRFIK